MLIEYYIRNVYGKDLCYIKDPTTRGLHLALTGRATISTEDMRNYSNFSREYITFKLTTQ